MSNFPFPISILTDSYLVSRVYRGFTWSPRITSTLLFPLWSPLNSTLDVESRSHWPLKPVLAIYQTETKTLKTIAVWTEGKTGRLDPLWEQYPSHLSYMIVLWRQAGTFVLDGRFRHRHSTLSFIYHSFLVGYSLVLMVIFTLESRLTRDFVP